VCAATTPYGSGAMSLFMSLKLKIQPFPASTSLRPRRQGGGRQTGGPHVERRGGEGGWVGGGREQGRAWGKGRGVTTKGKRGAQHMFVLLLCQSLTRGGGNGDGRQQQHQRGDAAHG